MASIHIERGCVVIDGAKLPLLSGSVHYWRLDPASWRPILETVCDLGLEVVDTYVAWEFHELSPGHFDFGGEAHPRRDLPGFLRLVEELGLRLIVRPGPFIYAEWVNMGVPADVAAYHRLHPRFQERAAEYIAAVSAVLAPHQATRGGAIVLLQADNEVDPFEYCYEEQLGLNGGSGLFQAFLEERYGTVAALNRRWGTRLVDFASARPVMSLPNRDDRYLARFYDFLDFRFDYVARAVAWFRDEYRRHGIDVPILHNTYDILSVQDARRLANGVIDVVGTDAYPPNNFERLVSTGESISHRRFMEFLRYYRTFSDTNFLAEFQAGIGHGLHYYSGVLTPNHYRLSTLSALMAGANAWNWYMLVNRDNWMMSPINEWGRRQRELFDVFKEMISLYRAIDVPAAQKLTQTGAVFYLKHQVLPTIEDDPILQALYESGIDFEFFDVETGNIGTRLLFYAGDDWLPRACQRRLLEYVKRGGNLVLFPGYPARDERFRPWNGLAMTEPDGALNEPFLDHLATEIAVQLGDQTVHTRAPAFTWATAPGEPIYGTRVDADIRDSDLQENRLLRSLIIGRRYIVGYRERRGDGSLLVLGIRPTAETILAVHRLLGISIPVRPDDARVKAAAFRCGDARYVIAVNIGKEALVARLELGEEVTGGKALRARDLRTGLDVPAGGPRANIVWLELAAKDGTVIQVCPGAV